MAGRGRRSMLGALRPLERGTGSPGGLCLVALMARGWWSPLPLLARPPRRGRWPGSASSTCPARAVATHGPRVGVPAPPGPEPVAGLPCGGLRSSSARRVGRRTALSGPRQENCQPEDNFRQGAFPVAQGRFATESGANWLDVIAEYGPSAPDQHAANPASAGAKPGLTSLKIDCLALAGCLRYHTGGRLSRGRAVRERLGAARQRGRSRAWKELSIETPAWITAGSPRDVGAHPRGGSGSAAPGLECGGEWTRPATGP